MAQLVIPSFGGGVVLTGSADAKKTDEMSACDAFDIGERGQLAAASTIGGTESSFTAAYGVAGSSPDLPAIVIGASGGFFTAEDVGPEPGVNSGTSIGIDLTAPVPTAGWVVTSCGFPYVASDVAYNNPVLVNVASRSTAMPNTGLGLMTMRLSGGAVTRINISTFDALGTGATATSSSSHAGGTKAKQLYFRGIAAYNNHVFGYGFDNADATNADGRNRLMFSNTGNPYMWGNDNKGGTDRDFTDSDAITIGAAGDRVTALYAWNGKLWIATERELHWLAGYGRESFLTDGTNVQFRENVIGPNAMIEGPDGLLYGVGTRGLWVLDGASCDPIGRALTNFGRTSPGWWDLIWTDRTRAEGYPGKTNQDLVWMLSDREMQQVWVVIPFCNATSGAGVGSDTVVIKYHVKTGGFSRQVFAGASYIAGMTLPRTTSGQETRLAVSSVGTVGRYAYRTAASTSPAMPAVLPSATFGPYAPYGPHGTGTHRVCYLTLGWESASSLPLVFTVTPSVDQQAGDAMKVSIQSTTPAAPADGDYWLDTSGTDTNIGTATASTLTPAAADYVWKTYSSSRASWIVLPHGGQKGTRATLRLAFRAMRGTRISLAYATTSAAGRFQIESLGLEPAAARDAA